jgi:hypothetical protein
MQFQDTRATTGSSVTASSTDIHELREPKASSITAFWSGPIATAGRCLLCRIWAYQLLASIQNNAEAAKLPLKQLLPDLKEVQEILNRTVGITPHAAAIIKHLRLSIKRKGNPEDQQFDLNESSDLTSCHAEPDRHRVPEAGSGLYLT